MITKLATFRGVSSSGEPLVRLFEPASLVKEAGEMMPQVKQWLDSYKPEGGKLAILVNAMGASEYWGQNVNGDIFPEAALIHDCRNHKDQQHPYDEHTGKLIPPYGYWTFLDALPFVHHRNKDPSRAFGKVALAVWNPKMHRVELVVIIDKAAALQHGAAEVVDRILAGEYPDVSMGCRVPYDVCTICGNRSKTRNDYCACITQIGMGKILDDGRRIGVLNIHPRFFDISFVFIGADKTAKVMCKLASGLTVPQSVADADVIYGDDVTAAEGLVKAAAVITLPMLEEDDEEAQQQEEDPADEAGERLMFGRTDEQGSAASVGDGIVRTNAGDGDEESALVERGGGMNIRKIANHRAQIQDFYVRRASGENPAAPGNVDRRSEVMEFYSKKAQDEELSKVWADAKLIKIGPPPSPNRRKFPFVGTIEFRGLTVHVENKPGDVRSGTNPVTGKSWRTEMMLPYGEIAGTRGADDDKLDVYVGPHRDCGNVYIVHQNFVGGPKDGKYDEDKVMLGFSTLELAKSAYLAHYNNDKFFRSITTMSFPMFKRLVLSREGLGEKMASPWGTALAKIAMEDVFAVAPTNDTKEKTAANLDELFTGAPAAQRRQRLWRDQETKRETKIVGSGMDQEVVKTASVRPEVLALARVLKNGWSPEDLLKVSNELKAASHLKWADIIKEIGPSKAVGKVSPLLSEQEPSLPRETLNEMGEQPELECSLTTPSLMGMVLKPEEFQRILLAHMGKSELADRLDAAGATFTPTTKEAAPCKPLHQGQFDSSLMDALMPYLEKKSYLGPVVRRRIARLAHEKLSSHRTPIEVDSFLLTKVSSAYTWYRREQLKLSSAFPATVTSNPALHAEVLGINTEDLFSKTAELGLDRRSVMLLLGTVPLSLMYAAHKRRQMERGEDIGPLASLIAEHPWLTSMGVVSGLGALLRDPRAQQAVDEAFAAGGRIWRGKQVPTNA